jgi:DNA-binding IclR family transcriptional regulator
MIQSLQRALGVLEIIANNHAPIGSTEISRRAKLHASTTHHLLQTLASLGYLAQDAQTREYYIGSKIFQVAALAWNEANLLKLAVPAMADVAHYAGETAHLSLITQNEITVIHKVEGKDPIHVSARVGYPSPAHCTANGKILLATFPKDQLKEFLSENELRPFTPNSVTSIELLERELNRVRAQGYAVDNQEFKIGVRCIAAPLRNFTGQVIAAIGISGPAWRMTEESLPDLAEYLTAVARRLSLGLGYSAPDSKAQNGRSLAGPETRVYPTAHHRLAKGQAVGKWEGR